MPVRKSATETVVQIKPVEIAHLEIRIVGDTELILHRFSDKMQQVIEDDRRRKAMGEAKPKGQGYRTPEEKCEDAFYRIDANTPGFPAHAFKAASVEGCRFFEGITMTLAQRAIRISGVPVEDYGYELVPIEGRWRMRRDTVRLETGVADLRYRPGFPRWRATLRVTHVVNVLSQEQVTNLVNAGGMCGVGEWRPSAPKVHSGIFGCYHVANDEEWEEYGRLLNVPVGSTRG